MDHRDRATPVALPRYAPVAQAESDGALAGFQLFQLFDRGALGGGDVEAIEEAGIDGDGVVGIGKRLSADFGCRLAFRGHHGLYGKLVFAGEVEVGRSEGARVGEGGGGSVKS